MPGTRVELGARLRERRPEIERELQARVSEVSDPRVSVEDPDYTAGLRTAVTTALDYGIGCIEAAALTQPIPDPLRFQARAAARAGISVDTVLRRYFSGYALLGDFLMQAAEQSPGLQGPDLQRVLREKAALLDRLVATVAEEHSREITSRPTTAAQRRAERVRMLLCGELVDAPELEYELDAWHLGAIAQGPGAMEALRELATRLQGVLLAVQSQPGRLWAWVGTRREPSPQEAVRAAPAPEICLSLGEPGQGLSGWRLTHRQAAQALPIALRQPGSAVRYGKVALLASALGNDVLASTLESLYLRPLQRGRDGGEAIRVALHAYFAAGRNVASAAAAMDLSRQTVNSRLRAAEERIGRCLEDCGAELQTALELGEWDRSLFAPEPSPPLPLDSCQEVSPG